MLRATEHKILTRRSRNSLNKMYLTLRKPETIKLRKIPMKLTRLIKNMYGQLCVSHSTPLTRTHLQENHGIAVDPIQYLIMFQTQESSLDKQLLKTIKTALCITERLVNKK